jgi:hypothetical protein
MSNNAIYHSSAYHLIDIVGHDVELEPVEKGHGRRIRVDVMAPTLVIDPTDDQWFAARRRRASKSARLR